MHEMQTDGTIESIACGLGRRIVNLATHMMKLNLHARANSHIWNHLKARVSHHSHRESLLEWALFFDGPIP